MWLSLLVLFAALSPGVLFTIPSLGKKMGGKVVIAAMHAVLFVIVLNLLSVAQEGFQAAKAVSAPSVSDIMGQSQAAANTAAEGMNRIQSKVKAGGKAQAKINAIKNSLNTTLNDMSLADDLIREEEQRAAAAAADAAAAAEAKADAAREAAVVAQARAAPAPRPGTIANAQARTSVPTSLSSAVASVSNAVGLASPAAGPRLP
jgi:Skp family chaperone for outer membrane proteins